MNPAQARRERRERYRASGEALTVRRHGNPIGIIQWDGANWNAIATDSIACGRWATPAMAEKAVIAHAKDRAAERGEIIRADREANDAEIRDRFDRSKVDAFDNAWGFDGDLTDLADMGD